jgi:hypothetical protein
MRRLSVGCTLQKETQRGGWVESRIVTYRGRIAWRSAAPSMYRSSHFRAIPQTGEWKTLYELLRIGCHSNTTGVEFERWNSKAHRAGFTLATCLGA